MIVLRSRKRLWRRLLSAFCTVATLLALAAVASGARRPQAGGVLRLPTDSPIHSLDPLEVRWPAEAALASMIYDSPYAVDPGERVARPHLLRPVKLVNGRTLNFKVRQHALFHDGSPVRAEAVLESLRRLAASPERGWLLAMVEGAAPGARSPAGLKLVGSNTVQIKVGSPADVDLLLTALATAQAGVVPSARRATRAKGVGTGPFVLRSGAGPDRRLRANRDYFDGPPYLSEVHLLGPVPREEHIRRFQLEKADASLLGDSVYGEPPPLQAVALTEGPPAQLVYLVFNTARGVVRELPLRRAVDLALDRARLAGPTAQPLAFQGPGGLTAFQARDPERARLLIAGLGIDASTRPLALLVEEADAFGVFLAPQIQRDLSAVGLPVTQVIAPAAEVRTRLASGTWDLRLVTESPVSPDEILRLGQVLALGGLHAEAARLVAQAGAHRQAEVKRAVGTLASQLAVIPLCARRPRLHHRSDLRGAAYDAVGRLSIADLWLRPPALAGAR